MISGVGMGLWDYRIDCSATHQLVANAMSPWAAATADNQLVCMMRIEVAGPQWVGEGYGRAGNRLGHNVVFARGGI